MVSGQSGTLLTSANLEDKELAQISKKRKLGFLIADKDEKSFGSKLEQTSALQTIFCVKLHNDELIGISLAEYLLLPQVY